MKEKINQIERLLREINEQVEKYKEVENIDIKYIDRFQDTYLTQESFYSFKKIIVGLKNESAEYMHEQGRLELILSNTLSQIQALKRDSSKLTSLGKIKIPNNFLASLIHQNILTTSSIIFATFNGMTVFGNLTKDGYLELEINGIKQKYRSLRRAAYGAFRIPLQRSQWEFWKVKDQTKEGKPLEYYIKLIDSSNVKE
jgi:hypothetical protein